MASKKSKFELVVGAVDRLTGPFKKVQKAFAALGSKADELKARLKTLGHGVGFSQLVASVVNVRERFRALGAEGKAAIGKVGGAVGKLSLAFGAAGGGALALVKATANAGDAAAKSAARAGTSIAVWQEYAHAASLSDLSEEELAKGFRKLQDTAIKAVSGGKNQASLFKMAGIDPKNEKGEVKNAESLFLELSDKIKSLVDGGKNAQATNLLTGMFGDKGASLLPMLAGGADALKEMRQEAYDLGLVFSDEDAHASEAFGDALTRVGQVLQGIGNAIGKAVMPFVTKLAEKFTEWAKGSHEIIGSGFREWIDSLDVDRVFDAIQSGLSTLKSFWQSLQAGVRWIGGWGNVLKIAAAIILTKVVVALAALSGSFLSLGVAIMATPFGWVMAAIAALAAAGYAIVKNWDAIAAWWDDFCASFSESFDEAFKNLKTILAALNPLPLFRAAWDKVKAWWEGFSLADAAKKIIAGIWKVLTTFTPLGLFVKAWDMVSQYFGGFSLADAAKKIIAGIWKVLATFTPLGLFVKAWDMVSQYFGGISLADAGKKIIDSLLGGLKGAWDKVIGWMKSAGGAIADFFSFGEKAANIAKPLSQEERAAFPMADAMNLAPAAAGIMGESVQKTETVERNEVKILVSSKDQTPVEAALSGRDTGAVSLDTGQLMQGAR